MEFDVECARGRKIARIAYRRHQKDRVREDLKELEVLKDKILQDARAERRNAERKNHKNS